MFCLDQDLPPGDLWWWLKCDVYRGDTWIGLCARIFGQSSSLVRGLRMKGSLSGSRKKEQKLQRSEAETRDFLHMLYRAEVTERWFERRGRMAWITIQQVESRLDCLWEVLSREPGTGLNHCRDFRDNRGIRGRICCLHFSGWKQHGHQQLHQQAGVAGWGAGGHLRGEHLQWQNVMRTTVFISLRIINQTLHMFMN